METVFQDVRYAFRQLLCAPGFTAVAALTLAIGIGANTALFSLADAILARPLPEIGAPAELVWVSPFTTRGGPSLSMSYPDFRDYCDSTGVFSSAAAFAGAEFSISSNGEPTRVKGALVGGDYFRTLQVRMELGRGFSPEDDRVDAQAPAAVISHRLWKERFRGALTALGARILIDGRPFTVVGVTPERFNGPDHSERRDVWVPLSLAGIAMPGYDSLLTSRNSWWLRGIGRLAPGVSLERANAAVATVAARVAHADSSGHGDVTARVVPLRNGLSPSDGNDIYRVATLAAAVTVLILLIACANVSNLLVARAVGRRREIAVRLSIGAARGRIVRQLLTESVMLSLLGSALGFLAATWATDVIASIIPAPIDVSANLRVLWFAIGAACLTGIGFGVVPALHATRGDVVAALKDATVGFDRMRARLQRGFVVAQISLSLILLVTAGMFLGALYKASHVDLRFDASSRVLAMSFNLGRQGYTPERASAFLDLLSQRAAALPGVEATTVTNQVPMGERHIGADVSIEHDPNATARFGEGRGLEVYVSTIRPAYFRTIDVPLARGRDFTSDDRAGSLPVAIVSEDFARTAWPDADPIGKRVSTSGAGGQFSTVVGVAREALTMGVAERQRPIVYLAQAQRPREMELTFLVRRVGDAVQIAPELRRVLREMDRDLPVYDVQTLEQYRRDRSSESRIGSTLLAIFGGLALLLATIGVYAVTAFAVGQRTREIGVRVALGAANADIAQLFLGEGARLVAVGVTIGLVLSLGVARLLSAAFLGLRMSDALTFALGASVLAAAALAASWLPARRAARVDPMVALRAE